jgi:SAM-dependent methyltransferase
MILQTEDFEKILNFNFSDKARKIIDSYNIEVEDLTDEEINEQIENINSFLNQEYVVRAGSHRINDWNNGWNENNLEFERTKSSHSLIPKYFGKYKFIRFDNKFKKVLSLNCELNTLRVLQIYLLEKYCNNINNFYEFGCGTGHNLFAISEFMNKGSYFGFDWSNPPRNIFNNINKFYNKNFSFDNFDFVNPNEDIKILPDSVVFTFAALEQIGEKHDKFIDYLVHNKPTICIHLEPISEVLDKNDLLQDLSIKYIEKRNYLSNFYNNLKKLEQNNKIEIIDVARTTIGSYFIEGYSLIIWKVL